VTCGLWILARRGLPRRGGAGGHAARRPRPFPQLRPLPRPRPPRHRPHPGADGHQADRGGPVRGQGRCASASQAFPSMIDNRAARRRGRSPILGVTETEQFLAAMSWQITEAETALHGGDAGHRVRSVGRWHRVDEQAAERLMRTSGEKLESRVGAGNDRVDQFVRKRRSFSHRCQFDLGPRAVVNPWRSGACRAGDAPVRRPCGCRRADYGSEGRSVGSEVIHLPLLELWAGYRAPLS